MLFQTPMLFFFFFIHKQKVKLIILDTLFHLVKANSKNVVIQ